MSKMQSIWWTCSWSLSSNSTSQPSHLTLTASRLLFRASCICLSSSSCMFFFLSGSGAFLSLLSWGANCGCHIRHTSPLAFLGQCSPAGHCELNILTTIVFPKNSDISFLSMFPWHSLGWHQQPRFFPCSWWISLSSKVLFLICSSNSFTTFSRLFEREILKGFAHFDPSRSSVLLPIYTFLGLLHHSRTSTFDKLTSMYSTHVHPSWLDVTTDQSMKPHPPQSRKGSNSFGNSLIVKDKSRRNQVTAIRANTVTLSPNKNEQFALVVQNQQWSPDKALSLIWE